MSDLERWQELKAGSKEALEQIYSTEVAHLLLYGKKFSSDEQLVEDCIHDLFVELWKNREGLSPTDSIRRYLLVSLRRKVIRKLDQQRKRLSNDEPEEHHFDATLSIDMEMIEMEMIKERHEQLSGALESLSPRQKEVIYLKYFSEMDYEAIGEIMGISYQSARNLVFKALHSLKKHMVLFWLVVLNFFY